MVKKPNPKEIGNALQEVIRYGITIGHDKISETINNISETISVQNNIYGQMFVYAAQKDFEEYISSGGIDIIPDTITDVVIDPETNQKAIQIIMKKK